MECEAFLAVLGRQPLPFYYRFSGKISNWSGQPLFLCIVPCDICLCSSLRNPALVISVFLWRTFDLYPFRPFYSMSFPIIAPVVRLIKDGLMKKHLPTGHRRVIFSLLVDHNAPCHHLTFKLLGHQIVWLIKMSRQYENMKDFLRKTYYKNW